MEKIYTLKQVAKILELSERTIFRYLKTGKISGSKIGHWRFTEQDVKEFLEKNKVSIKVFKKAK